MLLRILSKLIRRSRTPDLIQLHRDRLTRLRIDARKVREGLERGEILLEDLGEQDP